MTVNVFTNLQSKKKEKTVEMEIKINYYPLKELVKTNHVAEKSIVCSKEIVVL